MDNEDRQALRDDSGNDEDNILVQQFGKGLREVMGLGGPSVRVLLDDGLTSPLALFQTAETELDKLFRGHPIFGARDRRRLKCFRSAIACCRFGLGYACCWWRFPHRDRGHLRVSFVVGVGRVIRSVLFL